MALTPEVIRLSLQLLFSIATVLWYPVGVFYRWYHSRRLKVGFWDIDTPSWHKIILWPIILGLFIFLMWGTLAP